LIAAAYGHVAPHQSTLRKTREVKFSCKPENRSPPPNDIHPAPQSRGAFLVSGLPDEWEGYTACSTTCRPYDPEARGKNNDGMAHHIRGGTPMTHEEFVKLLEERGDSVYIADRGLIRFAKFAIAVLGVFTVIVFSAVGWDIKKAADEAKEARFQTKETLLELAETKAKFLDAQTELNKSRASFEAFINTTRQAMQTHLDTAAQSVKRALGFEQQVAFIQLKLQQYGESRGLLTVVTAARTEQATSPAVPMPGTTIHIALVSEVKELAEADLARVAVALQKQASRDLKPLWNVGATVEPFKTLEDAPSGYWPIIIKKDIGVPGAGAIHTEKNGEPFGMVTYRGTLDDWALSASHTMLEMLVDPLGNRMSPGPSPNPADNNKTVSFLVQIADPVESAENAYQIDGILVSDFVTPAFYSTSSANGARVSFTGAAKDPFRIMKGGYMSWQVPETKEWHQARWFLGEKPEFVSFGKIE
jgi:hypothetical protein